MEYFLCSSEDCYYPAQSRTEFMDPRSGNIIDHCPNCDNTRTITQRIFNFRVVWDLLNGMNLTRQLELGDITLRLQELGDDNPTQERLDVEIPEDVQNELEEKIRTAQGILTEAQIHDFLELIKVRVLISANASRSG